jgi:hypothetical protein
MWPQMDLFTRDLLFVVFGMLVLLIFEFIERCVIRRVGVGPPTQRSETCAGGDGRQLLHPR